MTPSDLLILALAAWYGAVALALLDGPFKLFALIRATWPLGGLTACVYCLAPWLFLLCWAVWGTEARIIVQIGAGAGGIIFLHRFSGGNML